MIILVILESKIFGTRTNLEISRQRDFTLVKYYVIIISRCAIDISLFSSNCILTSFFFENGVAKVSHATFGVSTRLMCSNISSSMLVLIANKPSRLKSSTSPKLQHSQEVWFCHQPRSPTNLSLQVGFHANRPCVVILVVEPSNAIDSLEIRHHNLVKSLALPNMLGPKPRTSQSQTVHEQNEHLQKYCLRHHKRGP